MGGFNGVANSRDFCTTDHDMAYVFTAQAMAMTVVDLLVDGAKKAKAIK